MKILVATHPYHGHVLPTIPLVTRLSQRGHEVLWYTAEKYTNDAHAIGAELLPMTHIPPSTPAKLDVCIRRFEAIAQAQHDEMLAHCDVDLILADPTVLAAPQLWMEGGPPYVMLSILPLLVAPPDVPLILQATIPSFEYAHPENTNIACIGPLLPVGAANRATPEMDPSHWWHTLDHAKPILHVTQGTVTTRVTDLILPTLEACADLPVQLIAQAPRGTVQTSMVPPNARLVDWFDHAVLLPRCAAFITNGGYSGVQRALAGGVPIIAGGWSEDKPEIAARIAWAGNGINLGTGVPTPEMVRTAITTLAHTPRYQERAWELAARCQQYDAATNAAMLLEDRLPKWRQQKPMPARPMDLTQQAVA